MTDTPLQNDSSNLPEEPLLEADSESERDLKEACQNPDEKPPS